MARRTGDNVAILTSEDGLAAWTSLGCIRSATYNRTRTDVDLTCGGDLNTVSRKGKPNSQLTGEAVYDDLTVPALMDVADSEEGAHLRFVVDNVGAPNQHWTGIWDVDMNISAAINQAATIAITAVARGDVTFAPGP